MKKQIVHKMDRMFQAHQDYDFGYSQPIFRGAVKDGLKYIESLDIGKLPAELRKTLVAMDESLKKLSVTIQALNHIWILKGTEVEWMLRKVRKELMLYDCSDSILQKIPSIQEVADWHDLDVGYVRKQATAEKWYSNRKLRLEEMETEVMEAARSGALENYIETTEIQMRRLQRMGEIYDKTLDSGKAVITARDVLAATGLQHRLKKDMVSLGRENNTQQTYIQLLIQTGLGERIDTDGEVIDAEVTDVEVIGTAEESDG